MTAETNKIQWVIDNSAKIKSVIGAIALYIGGIEAAHPTQSFWEVFTNGFSGALTIVAGIIGAAVAGYRTDSTAPTKWQVRQQTKIQQAVSDELDRRNGNGEA